MLVNDYATDELGSSIVSWLRSQDVGLSYLLHSDVICEQAGRVSKLCV